MRPKRGSKRPTKPSSTKPNTTTQQIRLRRPSDCIICQKFRQANRDRLSSKSYRQGNLLSLKTATSVAWDFIAVFIEATASDPLKRAVKARAGAFRTIKSTVKSRFRRQTYLDPWIFDRALSHNPRIFRPWDQEFSAKLPRIFNELGHGNLQALDPRIEKLARLLNRAECQIWHCDTQTDFGCRAGLTNIRIYNHQESHIVS